MSTGAQERAAASRLAALIAASRPALGPNAVVARSATAREVQERIAARLAWLRRSARLTRREFAAMVASGEPASVEQRLWRYETGRAAAPASLLVRVAEVFDVSVEVFTSERVSAAELHTRVRRHPDAAARLLDEGQRGNSSA